MSPVAKAIRKAFNDTTATLYRDPQNEARSLTPICERYAFRPEDQWMYDYLFPEIISTRDGWGRGFYFPCKAFPTETILRIMAECGIID